MVYVVPGFSSPGFCCTACARAFLIKDLKAVSFDTKTWQETAQQWRAMEHKKNWADDESWENCLQRGEDPATHTSWEEEAPADPSTQQQAFEADGYQSDEETQEAAPANPYLT